LSPTGCGRIDVNENGILAAAQRLLHLAWFAPEAAPCPFHIGYIFAACEPVELLDVGEVEDLEGRLNPGLRFAELLDRKNKSTPQNRALSLHNYLTVVGRPSSPVGCGQSRCFYVTEDTCD
jgi:hypothetical protein